MRFPFIRPDLPPPREWQPFVEEMQASRRYSNFGPLSRRLERELLADWGSPALTCVLTSSGTAALVASLLASGLRGRLLVPAFSFPASLCAVRQAGLEPLLIDVDPRLWSVTPERLEDALRQSDAAGAMVVQPFGLRRDLGEHLNISHRLERLLLIDNAAGLGTGPCPLRDTPAQGRPLVWEACSMHTTKPFGLGEGGVVFAPAEAEETLRRVLNFGLPPGGTLAPDGDPPGKGFNGKLSEFHAAVGLAVRRGFADRLRRRRSLVADQLALLRGFEGLGLPGEPQEATWGLLPLTLPAAADAERLMGEAAALGMEVRRVYRPALTAWRDVPRLGPCPVAEDLAERMVGLPVYSDLPDQERQPFLQVIQIALERSLSRR